MTLFGGDEPHEFKPGTCALCGAWHTNPIHDVAPSLDGVPVPVGTAHPETAKEAARLRTPKFGSELRTVYALIANAPEGLTADEVDIVTEWGHSSSSSAVSTLKKHGWIGTIERDGKKIKRKTRKNRWAEVMVIARPLPPEERERVA